MMQAIDSASVGLSAALQRFDRTAASIARAGTPGESDLVADLVTLRTEKIAVAASARVLRTADEMLGTVIDLLA
jgi:hypothetical protein